MPARLAIQPRVLHGQLPRENAAVVQGCVPFLRSAWDGRPLALLTRTAPARATDAHVSIIGHITQTELRRHTTTVEIANGFLNRNADLAGMPTSV